MGTLPAFLQKHIGVELDGASMGIRQQDDESGPLTLNLGLVHADASLCTAAIDIRYPVTSDGSAIIETIQKTARAEGVFRGGRPYEAAVPACRPSVYRPFAERL